MFKENTYINAGDNQIYRWGKKAQDKMSAYLEPNKSGFIAIPVDGGKYWAFGTSNGKFGEFMKFEDTFFSVNRMGVAYAKVGTEKADKLTAMIRFFIDGMKNYRSSETEEDEEDEQF